MDMTTPARLKLDTLPDSPGIYLYRDRGGRILYVGKAKSLKSRVRSYFQGSTGQAPKTDALVSEVHDLEYIVTATEVEALILENNLVKKERPRYNIRLRDDKNFPYLKMTTNERFPRVVLVRRARLDGNAYFGPYLPASAALPLMPRGEQTAQRGAPSRRWRGSSRSPPATSRGWTAPARAPA